MENDKLRKLKALLDVANDGLSKQEFLDSFKKIMDHFLQLEKKLIEKIDYKTIEEKNKLDELKQEFNRVIEAAKLESDNSLSGFKRKTVELINSLFAKSQINQKLSEVLNGVDFKLRQIDEKMEGIRSGLDGKDGKDADETKIINEVIKKIEVPDLKEKLEPLKKEIEELKARPIGRGGGGTSAMGVAWTFKHIAHTEEPTGAIDGVNKTYTVNNNIFWIAGFTLNGEQIAELPNFTYSGRTITFSTAIPAAYNGKDFEVKYIGT
jgi:hypothetical protein